jgi:hypothetical protein
MYFTNFFLKAQHVGPYLLSFISDIRIFQIFLILGYNRSLIRMIVVLGGKSSFLFGYGKCGYYVARYLLASPYIVAVDIPGLLVCIARQGHHLKWSKG